MSDREFEWVKEIDAEVEELKTLPIKMQLMTAAFNRMTVMLAGAIATVIAAAILIIFFGRPVP